MALGSPGGVRAGEIARALDEVVAAVDQARSVGLPIEIPDDLYRACAEIIARYEGPRSPDGAPSRSPRNPGDSASDHASVHDVPLRRLLWQVLDPGEEFTVNEIVQRLAALGVHPSANAVSNALGYWVSRRRLDRLRKGVYLFPVTPKPASAAGNGINRAVASGASGPTKRREVRNDRDRQIRKQAM